MKILTKSYALEIDAFRDSFVHWLIYKTWVGHLLCVPKTVLSLGDSGVDELDNALLAWGNRTVAGEVNQVFKWGAWVA